MSHQLYRAASTGAVAAAAALLTVAAAPAAIAQPGASGGDYTCSGGSWETGPAVIPSGTYSSLTVSGICMVPDGSTVNVTGNLTVEAGATFATFSTATMHIRGNVLAGAGSVFGYGCSEELGCNPAAEQSIRGNVIATKALAVYLVGAHVMGNVTVTGGGPGQDCVDNGFPPLGHDLPIKDNTIDGNVMINGWAGCWAGLIRNTIGGNVTYQGVTANLDAVTNPQGPDSNEIVANTIGGFLSCRANAPTPQYGDAGTPPYATNQARGFKGQCAAL